MIASREPKIDRTRDTFLTGFGKKTLENQYLQKGETYQDLFARVACTYGNDSAHTQRLYDYMSNLWFMPSTPILANGGTQRGLPISCFLNEANDSLPSIIDLWTENAWLSSKGGGIGSYWGNLRPINQPISKGGMAVGVIPFMKVMESISLAVDQGSLRRGAAAAYLPISHPEIEDFIDLRKPTGGDYNRKALYLHHGVLVCDAFMEALERQGTWDLINPQDGSVTKTVSAVWLWIRLLNARMETGEPYILFIDAINRALPVQQRLKNLRVKTSNLCTEITLPTGIDDQGMERTAVCCLSSLNLEKYLEWKDHPTFVLDIFYFLDNVLEDFIAKAPSSIERARYSAQRERSVGLGVMGFHSFLQSQNVPWETAVASAWNRKIFTQIKEQADQASKQIAKERGACPDAADCNIQERFSNKIAIAPTASISIICGGTSPGIEAVVSNAYTHKTLSGSFFVRNPYLEALLEKRGLNIKETWDSIMAHNGSVQHLKCMSDHEKKVFKTAFELDQKWLIELAAERQPFICQSQSLNLFLAADIHKQELHEIHCLAWKKGLKGMYYLRSRSIQRPENSQSAQRDSVASPVPSFQPIPMMAAASLYQECLACQ